MLICVSGALAPPVVFKMCYMPLPAVLAGLVWSMTVFKGPLLLL